MKKLSIAILLIISISLNCFAEDKTINLYRGELKGSKILIAVPTTWNKNLLIIAHGYRKEGTPLYAEFPYNDKFYKTLLNEGWMVASTSYRKNGLVIKEGIEDIGFLQEFISKTYGKPSKVYLEGFSMGSGISTLLSERHPEAYTGILCVCPGLGKWLKVNYKPKVPMVFLPNQNETEQVKQYMAKLDEGAVTPGLWTVKRDGHCKLNAEEELLAFRAMVAYADKQPITMTRDILINLDDRSSVAIFKDGRGYVKVLRVHPAYGNIDTEFVKSDLTKLGIKQGEIFTVQFGNNTYTPLLGKTYGDVSKGEWIAFLTVDGFLKIARNTANAAEMLGCNEGDIVSIRR